MESRDYFGYVVFEDGTIVNKRGRVMPKYYNAKGYVQSRLSIGGKGFYPSVHRVVAAAFLGPCPDGYEVDHINDVRDDNRACNLRYVTRRENRLKAYAAGNRNVKGERNANAKYTDKIEACCLRLEDFFVQGKTPCISELARDIGVPRLVVSNLWNGRQWRTVSQRFSFSSRFND